MGTGAEDGTVLRLSIISALTLCTTEVRKENRAKGSGDFVQGQVKFKGEWTIEKKM